jgi:hypothetical protein
VRGRQHADGCPWRALRSLSKALPAAILCFDPRTEIAVRDLETGSVVQRALGASKCAPVLGGLHHQYVRI